MAVGALVGLCALLWMLLTVERNKQAAVAVPATDSVSRSSPPSSAQVPCPRCLVHPRKPPAPVAASPLSGAPRASTEAKEVSPLAVDKGPDSTVEVPVPGAKLDHLSLAREAFNVRDWARALEEGKTRRDRGGGAEAHAVVGNTYFKMGRFAEAEQEYTKAAALDPANRLLRDRLSIAHAACRKPQSRQKK